MKYITNCIVSKLSTDDLCIRMIKEIIAYTTPSTIRAHFNTTNTVTVTGVWYNPHITISTICCIKIQVNICYNSDNIVMKIVLSQNHTILQLL